MKSKQLDPSILDFLIRDFSFLFSFALTAFCRHKILSMLSRNPPFTKAAESPLCTEALVDQLWKLMNSGKTDWESL